LWLKVFQEDYLAACGIYGKAGLWVAIEGKCCFYLVSKLLQQI
jgi:hypothetical protein